MTYWKLSDDERDKLKSWWVWLDDNCGDRAILRRASSPDDILLSEAFSKFIKQMPATWLSGERIQYTDASMIAAVVARIKVHNEKQSFAKSLAVPSGDKSNHPLSELRFSQLQKSRSEQEFFTRICRAIQLIGGKVNIISITEDMLQWLLEFRQGQARKPQQRLAVRWANDYYANLKN
ncbi:MAG: type I-E CRISPR-associated protein Cse2/CasB [Alteromonadaceae bacterium]|nr:MAG: type I-E CRISPR-associated protein Cse2/CasB [Alteromonadaceae bacterium]